MDKNFARWHDLKSRINTKQLDDVVYFHEREVWWCTLGLNVGSEQDGKSDNFSRPVLILRVFHQDALWILPLTSQEKQGRFYYKLSEQGDGRSAAILSQLRLISSKRLIRKLRTVSRSDFQNVRDLLKDLI